MSLILAAEGGSTLDFSAVNAVAEAIVGLVGKVVGMITTNPILFIGLGIGLFISTIGIVKRFI